MTVRLDYFKHADALPLQALTALSGYLHESDLDPQLLALIELRASQLRLPDGETLDRCYGELAAHFSPRAITRLTFAIIAINSWNRLNVAFGQEPGQYRSGDLKGAMNRALERFAELRPTSERSKA